MLAELPRLPSRPPLVALPPAVFVVGFAIEDHQSVVQALGELRVEGAPEPAALKRRAEFLAGRLAALHALKAFGLAGAPARRPDGTPSWPEPVVGSISHGAGRAFCAVARRDEFRSLGIDAERLLGQDAKLELRERICGARERALMAAALPEHHAVSVAFSAKESLFKCLYPMVGRYMDFGAAEVVALATGTAGAGELTLELSVDWSATYAAGSRFQVAFALAEFHVETALALPA